MIDPRMSGLIDWVALLSLLSSSEPENWWIDPSCLQKVFTDVLGFVV